MERIDRSLLPPASVPVGKPAEWMVGICWSRADRTEERHHAYFLYADYRL